MTGTEKEQWRQWFANWKVVNEVQEKLRRNKMYEPLSRAETNEQIGDGWCGPLLMENMSDWTPYVPIDPGGLS
jgi:hypothetical protein